MVATLTFVFSYQKLFTLYPTLAELQKRANRANQLVLFFPAGANFLGKACEKQAKTRENRQKQAKTGKKQALFWC